MHLYNSQWIYVLVKIYKYINWEYVNALQFTAFLGLLCQYVCNVELQGHNIDVNMYT